jgi:murein hydrolase activator
MKALSALLNARAMVTNCQQVPPLQSFPCKNAMSSRAEGEGSVIRSAREVTKCGSVAAARDDGAGPGITSWFSTLLAFLWVICSAPAALLAQAPVDQEISESQRRLDQIRREQEQLREDMTRIRSRVSDLSSEVTNLDRQAGVAAGMLGELDYQLGQRQEQLKLNTTELLMTRDLLAERRAVLYRRLRDIYKRGPLSTFEVLLTAESFSDLLNRYKYLYLIARHDRRLADDVDNLQVQLVARERALRNNRSQLENVRLERASETDQLAVLQSQRRGTLSSARSNETATAQRIAQLERDEASLGGTLAQLDTERRGAPPPAAGSTAAAVTLSPAQRGALAWPVEGTVLYNFGRVNDPSGVGVRWNGIGIGAPIGTPVTVVEAGTVMLAGPYEGFGPTVIVSHGGGYYTLYLYLAEVRVRDNEQVQRGQIIGTVGGRSTTEGPHIEFQLRVPGGQPVDPMIWLRRR